MQKEKEMMEIKGKENGDRKKKKKKIHVCMQGRGKKGENFTYHLWLNAKGKNV